MGNEEDESLLVSWNFWSTASSQVLAERRRGLWATDKEPTGL